MGTVASIIGKAFSFFSDEYTGQGWDALLSGIKPSWSLLQKLDRALGVLVVKQQWLFVESL